MKRKTQQNVTFCGTLLSIAVGDVIPNLALGREDFREASWTFE